MHGFIIESEISAKDVDALNKFAKSATADFDGGNLVSLAQPTAKGDNVYTATVPTTGALKGLWIAYNPQVKYTDVNGALLAGLSADVRAYTNVKGKVFDVFKPKFEDEILFSVDCVDEDTVGDAQVGDILESKNGQATLTRIAKLTGATANHTAFVIDGIETHQFPKAGIGVDSVKMFRCHLVQE